MKHGTDLPVTELFFKYCLFNRVSGQVVIRSLGNPLYNAIVDMPTHVSVTRYTRHVVIFLPEPVIKHACEQARCKKKSMLYIIMFLSL